MDGCRLTLRELGVDDNLIDLESTLQDRIRGVFFPRLDYDGRVGDGQPHVGNAEGIFSRWHVREPELSMVVGDNLPAQREKFDKGALQGGIARILYSSGDRAPARLRIHR